MITKRKYSPLYIVFELASTLRNAFFIALYIFIINQSDGWFMTSLRGLFFAFFGWLLIWSIINWFVEKYEMNEKAFVLYRGVWNKSEQTIPLSRIQNIHSKRNVFHRLFKVTALTLETAASGEDDTIKFPVISESEAKVIEESVRTFKETGNISGDMEEVPSEQAEEIKQAIDRTIHYVPTKKDLLFASFTSFNFLIIIPILFVIYRLADEFFEVDDYIAKGFGTLTASWILITIIVIGLLLISTVIGIVWTYLKYGNYELSSDDETIYIRKGIWEESQLTIQKHRVQGMEFEQTLLKRILRLTEVKLLMIQDEDSDVSSLYPFLPKRRAEEIVANILPDFEMQEETERLPIGALYVRLITTSIFALIVSIGLWIWQPTIFGYDWISLWIGPLLFVVFLIYRIISYKQTSYIFNGSFIQWKTGGFGTSRFMTRRKQIISIETSRGPLQRMFGLCTVKTVNRGKPAEENYLADIPLTQMQPFIAWYYKRDQEVVRIDDSYVPEQ